MAKRISLKRILTGFVAVFMGVPIDSVKNEEGHSVEAVLETEE
jgi:hypothetical protein